MSVTATAPMTAADVIAVAVEMYARGVTPQEAALKLSACSLSEEAEVRFRLAGIEIEINKALNRARGVSMNGHGEARPGSCFVHPSRRHLEEWEEPLYRTRYEDAAGAPKPLACFTLEDVRRLAAVFEVQLKAYARKRKALRVLEAALVAHGAETFERLPVEVRLEIAEEVGQAWPTS